MNYIFQNDKRLKDIIQTDGCFVRSCLHIGELETHKCFDADTINMLWTRAVNYGWLLHDNLKKPDLLIQESIKVLSGIDREVFQVGVFKHGIITYWDWIMKYPKYQNYNYLIQKVQTVNGNIHYRVVDRFGKVIFDPYSPQPEIDFVFESTLYLIT